MVTREEVLIAQKKWAQAIVEAGTLFIEEREKCEEKVDWIVDSLYAFDCGPVLFKPTKVLKIQFRINRQGAKSYFMGQNKDFSEDQGFATAQPWTSVEFENAGMILEEQRALAMGNYYFTNKKVKGLKVEYTFGYKKVSDGELKIDLHHSSLPFSPQKSS